MNKGTLKRKTKKKKQGKAPLVTLERPDGVPELEMMH